LFNVQLSNDLYSESFISERSIQEVEVRGNDKPYFQGVKRSPLVLKLEFAFEGYYDEQRIREVARWLDQDYYKPFYTSDNPERIFYCLLNSDSNLLHNGLKQGYITLEMRCDSPFSYSPEYVSKVYEWNEIPLTVQEKATASDFSKGTLTNVIVNSNQNLALNPVKKRWIDFPSSTTWFDLY
ncbi:phage tail protein, partial [Paenibacillus sp. LBL]|uniref:phage tail protein n=1 Tax=Paenibacillus sp. LBL TaxID=2940563 RepID=UPI0032AEF720